MFSNGVWCSGGSTGDDQTIIVDLDGAVKAIKASEQIDHQHFIISLALIAFTAPSKSTMIV
jgi:hypothetical protein